MASQTVAAVFAHEFKPTEAKHIDAGAASEMTDMSDMDGDMEGELDGEPGGDLGTNTPLEYLNHAFTTAQNAVMELQKKQHARFEMMTTAVALAIIDGKCAWGHIGDSRLYLFKRNRIAIRTLDHSVPQMLVMSGEIKEKKIRKHPDRNRLLRAIGIEWDSPRFETSEEYDSADCQAFLLCTDGFWEFIEDKRMCSLLRK